jgi:AcrR family transcriptional regulator
MTAKDAPSPDGRRRRSQGSRERIVAAMLDLVADGQITPSADQVASRASVGLRTVFRHFADMESLYAAMTGTLSQQYEMWQVPFASSDWRDQLNETIDRRLATYEKLLPFKRAADAHRHTSPTIQAEHKRTLDLMRQRLLSILPTTIVDNAAVLEAIDLMLSPEAWQRLRDEQNLSVDCARAVITAQIDALTEAR